MTIDEQLKQLTASVQNLAENQVLTNRNINRLTEQQAETRTHVNLLLEVLAKWVETNRNGKANGK